VLARTVAVVAVLALAGHVPPPAGAPVSQAEVPAGQTSSPAAAAPLSPRNANYTIAARLDPATRTLTGEERLSWRNLSSGPAPSLQFHLYYNAWRNTRSTWIRERLLAGDTEVAERPDSDWGWTDVTSARIVAPDGSRTDVTTRLRFIAPDDGNKDDRTVVELPLDDAVAPGETIDVEIGWSSRVPRTFARTGAVGDYFFLAQWFPKIGVLEDAGWNCHQFHSATEFYADFGNYDVRLTVPRGWIVGATGLERGRQDGADGTTTHHYYQEDVHDFAWTTSPAYLDLSDTFHHAALPSVRMRLLLQPEHAGQARRHFDATRAALEYYGTWYGAYRYGHITIVDPAWQSDAAGMEYPTLFTAGTRWLAPAQVAEPEEVTIHEAGHQFWYGIVATNEFEHAWMDEGLNTFSTARTLAQVFNPNYRAARYFGDFVPWVFDDLPVKRDTDGNRFAGYRLAARSDAQSVPTWRYWPGTASATTYNKTALWLNTLERMLGWETLQRALSTYFERWAFRHPKPDDFFAVINEVSGQDLTWFFDQVYRSSNVFDYAVDVFRSEPVAARGAFGAPGAPRFEAEENQSGTYHTVVVARREGEGVFPVDVAVTFEDGESVRWRWDGRERWKAFEIDRPVPATHARVDPERVLLLDVNYTNNSASLSPEAPRAARKWSLVWLIWLQDHLLTYGSFI
jgi:hypothetical protein